MRPSSPFVGPWSHPSTMRDARSGAIFPDRYVRLEPTRREINALLGSWRHRRAAPPGHYGAGQDLDWVLPLLLPRPHPYVSDPPLQPTAMAYGKFS